MKTKIYFSLVSLLFVFGCSNEEVSTVNPVENKLNTSMRSASPIAQWTKPAVMDNNDVLMTALWLPPSFGSAYPNYNFAQFQSIGGYEFSPYFVNGETEYNPANYDLMAHFGYFSPEDVDNAVIEFTFPHIKYFLPHMLLKDASGQDTRRVFTVNNVDNQTVIKCITDLKKEYLIPNADPSKPPKRIGSPMFCFLLKIDCGKGNNGYTTFWTDMKVNGVSVKGTIKNKVYECN